MSDRNRTDFTPLTLVELGELPVGRVRGAGDQRVRALRTLGIETVLDLLFHFPRRYLDRTRQATIAELAPGSEALVFGVVRSVSTRRTRQGRTMVQAEVTDHSGRLRLTFFNQPWRERQLRAGLEVALFGKVEVFRGARQMTNPVVDFVGDRTGRIVPVYPQSEKARLSSWELGELIANALAQCRARGIADPVPAPVRERFGLVSRDDALRWIHGPDTMAAAHRARDRLVFDELFRVQLALVARKRELESNSVGLAHTLGGEGDLVGPFLAGLPYELTGAQRRVVGEILADLATPLPMHRLLQGDVGAGKTVVALVAMLVAVQNGHQGALMAPTEVLAEQHAASLRELLSGMTITDDSSLFGNRQLEVAVLTNRTAAAERRRVLAGLADGSMQLVVGTHALIQDQVAFSSLGVVVIDEQHRFGVEQRAALRVTNADGTVPDVLVMTATPIPRTAAMTVYGDLDVSVLDELPPGRTPIHTSWARTSEEVAHAWEQVRVEVEAGHQAYVVCPIIEESEKLEVASATETYERLSAGELAGLRVGLLHGRLPGADKDEVMARFRVGDLDVLVATTVIEVGVDVPNATMMVILDADRFGIAQLHQLRGRVGRGSAASRCVLVAENPTPEGVARLEAMVATTDGFELAEVDLELRGEGTIMGERQKGRNDLRLASLRRDRAWVERARDAAFEVIDHLGGLGAHGDLVDEVRLFLGEDETDFLLKG